MPGPSPSRISCADCGETDQAVLELDHADDRSIVIGEPLADAMASTPAELARLTIVCGACRRRRVARRAFA